MKTNRLLDLFRFGHLSGRSAGFRPCLPRQRRDGACHA